MLLVLLLVTISMYFYNDQYHLLTKNFEGKNSYSKFNRPIIIVYRQGNLQNFKLLQLYMNFHANMFM